MVLVLQLWLCVVMLDLEFLPHVRSLIFLENVSNSFRHNNNQRKPVWYNIVIRGLNYERRAGFKSPLRCEGYRVSWLFSRSPTYLTGLLWGQNGRRKSQVCCPELLGQTHTLKSCSYFVHTIQTSVWDPEQSCFDYTGNIAMGFMLSEFPFVC